MPRIQRPKRQAPTSVSEAEPLPAEPEDTSTGDDDSDESPVSEQLKLF